MSVKWITWAWEQTCPNPGAKLILVALCDDADSGGRAWPAVRRMTEKTGIARSTAFRHMEALEAAGLILRTERARGNGSRTSSVIYVSPGTTAPGAPGHEEPPPPDEWGPRAESAPPPSQIGTGPVPDRHSPRPESGPPDPSSEPSVEPEEDPPTPRGTAMVDVEHFREFWKAYPRKVAKPDALKKFMTALKRDNWENIARGLRRWAAYWDARADPGYIPYPATWLNQERWKDTPPPLPAKQAKRDAFRKGIADLANGQPVDMWGAALEKSRGELGTGT